MAILADRNQIETLLLILLRNSLDAIECGGSIDITVLSNGDRIEIGITDDGCGISAAHQAKIFEPFFTTKPPGKGTGLGLAIAKTIVEQHGGEIALESMPDGGTRARVFFPVHVSRHAEAG